MNVRMKLAVRSALATCCGVLSRTSTGRILTYHSVGAAAASPGALTPETFRRQMDHLASTGYASATAAALAERWLAGDAADRTIAITFDDGLLDNFEVAGPILQQRRLQATFFVPTGFIGDDHQPVARFLPEYGAGQMLSWADVRQMAALGFEIGAHSHTHVLIRSLTRDQALEEVRRPREILEDKLGAAVTGFAYPKGHTTAFAPWTAELLREAGYRYGCTMMGGPLRAATGIYELPRNGVSGTDSLREFKMRLSGQYDCLKWFWNR